MKRWPRAWKARLINENNREWRDLYADLFEGVDARHKAGHHEVK